MQTEIKMILPTVGNDGEKFVWAMDRVLEEVLDVFGGYTTHKANGVWRNPETERVYRDKTLVVTIATEPNQENRLLAIAKNAASIMNQDCIYVCLSNGVHYVDQRPDRFHIAA